MKPALTLLALLLPLMAAAPLHAADDIVVQSASAELHDGVLEFSIQAEYPADEQTSTALMGGATVDVDLEVTVDLKNSFWFDERLVEDSFKRELTWNAPSQRFVLRDVDSGHQRTFATLEKALDAAGRIDGWQVPFTQELDPAETYEVAVRARLRRGRMPTALRTLTFWTRYWNRSEYYRWELPR